MVTVHLNNDIWSSDSDHNDDVRESNNELSLDLQKLKQVHSRRGYLDGISSSKEENLQSGFNESFPYGSSLGISIGELLGKLHLLSALYGDTDEKLRQNFFKAKNELCISEVLSQKYFDSVYDCLEVEHPVFKKWKHIVDQYVEKYT